MTIAGKTKDPGWKLFRRFQSSILAVEEKLVVTDLVRMDLSTKPQWVQDLEKETLRWPLQLLKTGVFHLTTVRRC